MTLPHLFKALSTLHSFAAYAARTGILLLPAAASAGAGDCELAGASAGRRAPLGGVVCRMRPAAYSEPQQASACNEARTSLGTVACHKHGRTLATSAAELQGRHAWCSARGCERACSSFASFS
jgi:hypothetical protein